MCEAPFSLDQRTLTRATARLLACAFVGVALQSPLVGAEEPAPPETAEAKTAEEATPEALYDAGKAKLTAGDAPGALVDFKRALLGAERTGDLGLNWQLLIAIAFTYREADKPGHAIEYFRRFLDSTERHRDALNEKWRKRRELAGGDIAQLERAANATHGYATVASTPPGAAITIDGVRAGADGDRVTPFGLYLKPGEYLIGVTLEGYEPKEARLKVAAGKLLPLAFDLTAITLAPDPAAPERTAGAASDPSPIPGPTLVAVAESEGPSFAPWAVIGAGGAILVTGVALAVVGEVEAAALSDFPPPTSGDTVSEDAAAYRDQASTAQTYQHASWGLLGLSAAVLTGGVVWLVLGLPEDSEAASERPALHIVPTRSGLMAGASWRF
ncbi:MAG: PEGA domain-containing protein [Myxococcota bacterium]|jgi:hypothetical protein|nr:PEGA domain-containing protein [Myxococcota bacterium]